MAITTHKVGASCLVAVTVQFDTKEINLGSHSSLVKNYKSQEYGEKSSSVSALFISPWHHCHPITPLPTL